MRKATEQKSASTNTQLNKDRSERNRMSPRIP